MYNYIKETLYLLGSREGNIFPLIKVIADAKGVKVCGLSASHKGQYAHAEKYAQDERGEIDTTQGHLHFRDSQAAQNWRDDVYADVGGRSGIRGGCSSIPPLDNLGGYLPIVTLGFSLPEMVEKEVRQRYRRAYCLMADLNNYPSDFLQVEVLLEGSGKQQLFSVFERGNVWQDIVFNEREPYIVFSIKAV
jgi:hypothetical protein